MSEHVQDQQDRRRFSIWVAGRLSKGLAEDIGGVARHDVDGGIALTGDLVDQSQIYGILDRLRQLGIEVLRFETYEPTGTEQTSLDAVLRRRHDGRIEPEGGRGRLEPLASVHRHRLSRGCGLQHDLHAATHRSAGWLRRGAWFPFFEDFMWDVFMPNGELFLILVIIFEIAVALLILNHDGYVDLGVGASVLWVLGVLPFLAWPYLTANLVLALMQGLILFRRYDTGIEGESLEILRCHRGDRCHTFQRSEVVGENQRQVVQ
jgi:hypothetical protein